MVRVLLDAHPDLPLSNGGGFTSALNRLPAGEKAWLPQTKAGKVNAWGLFFAAKKATGFTTAELRHALEAALQADKSLVNPVAFFAAKTNQLHREARNRDGDLQARVETFELAYRMQTKATDAFVNALDTAKIVLGIALEFPTNEILA